jgi:hypothetical protein
MISTNTVKNAKIKRIERMDTVPKGGSSISSFL